MKFEYKELESITTDNGRVYETPAGTFPSITTILSKTKDMTPLNEWRKRVGDEEADRHTNYAADRGTKVHKHMEDFMGGKEPDLSQATADEKSMFFSMKLFFSQHIKEVYAQEVPLYSPTLKYAGRTDLYGAWDFGYEVDDAIIDWKTSYRPKKIEWIKDYFVQDLAYTIAHNELYGTNITKGVILIAVETDLPQCFTIDFKKESWVWEEFGKRLSTFYRENPRGIEV